MQVQSFGEVKKQLIRMVNRPEKKKLKVGLMKWFTKQFTERHTMT
jgi:hypothetical protein